MEYFSTDLQVNVVYIYFIFTFLYKVQLLESHSGIVFKCLIHHAILTSTGNMFTKLFSFYFFFKICWTVWKWNYKLLAYFRKKIKSFSSKMIPTSNNEATSSNFAADAEVLQPIELLCWGPVRRFLTTGSSFGLSNQ